MDFMNGLKRTDYCGTLSAKDIGREIVVAGWVQRQRDLGALIFIDLRDRTGIVQLAFDDRQESHLGHSNNQQQLVVLYHHKLLPTDPE